MAAYKHILLATDSSTDDAPVNARAVEVAGHYGARLSLIHVVEQVPMDLSNDLIMAQPVDLDQELMDDARKRVDTLADELDVPQAQRHIALGSTKAEILRVAREQQVDLIIVGSHGRHGLALLLGSTATAVLHGTPCDVLAVRVNDQASER